MSPVDSRGHGSIVGVAAAWHATNGDEYSLAATGIAASARHRHFGGGSMQRSSAHVP